MICTGWEDPPEILDLGCDELFYSSGVSIVEWSERLGYLAPDECIIIDIDIIDWQAQEKYRSGR